MFRWEGSIICFGRLVLICFDSLIRFRKNEATNIFIFALVIPSKESIPPNCTGCPYNYWIQNLRHRRYYNHKWRLCFDMGTPIGTPVNNMEWLRQREWEMSFNPSYIHHRRSIRSPVTTMEMVKLTLLKTRISIWIWFGAFDIWTTRQIIKVGQ